jgi:hypothetical protein
VFFFLESKHKGKIALVDLMDSNNKKGVLAELQELRSGVKLPEVMMAKNWFSVVSFLKVFGMHLRDISLRSTDQFVRLDVDRNKRLSKRELARLNSGWTDVWLDRIFQEYPSEAGELVILYSVHKSSL